MKFEWNSAKAAANFKKHDVSFEEAVSALKDDLAATARDLGHSVAEFRIITFGVSAHGRFACCFSHGTRQFDSNHQRASSDAHGKEDV